jgi:hypothetical protein
MCADSVSNQEIQGASDYESSGLGCFSVPMWLPATDATLSSQGRFSGWRPKRPTATVLSIALPPSPASGHMPFQAALKYPLCTHLRIAL